MLKTSSKDIRALLDKQDMTLAKQLKQVAEEADQRLNDEAEVEAYRLYNDLVKRLEEAANKSLTSYDRNIKHMDPRVLRRLERVLETNGFYVYILADNMKISWDK